MKFTRNTVIIIIIVILLTICLLFDGNMMNMNEGFYVLPSVSTGSLSTVGRMSGANNTRMVSQPRVKSAQDLMQSERKVGPETKVLATGGAALMLLNSTKPTPTHPHPSMVEGFANPGDCLLPIPVANAPVANDTPNSNTPFGMQYAPRHYKQNGKPALFDMVEQPVDSKYPLLVLP